MNSHMGGPAAAGINGRSNGGSDGTAPPSSTVTSSSSAATQSAWNGGVRSGSGGMNGGSGCGGVSNVPSSATSANPSNIGAGAAAGVRYQSSHHYHQSVSSCSNSSSSSSASGGSSGVNGAEAAAGRPGRGGSYHMHHHHQRPSHSSNPSGAPAGTGGSNATNVGRGAAGDPQQQQRHHPSKHPSSASASGGGGAGGGAQIHKTTIPRAYSDWKIPKRYQIRHLIGTGSYGHVCEAYDTEEKRVVAIKRIHRVFEDLIDCKRILREISILNRLNHDHVVKVIDIVVPEDLESFDELYVVLEIADSDFKKLFRTPVYLSEIHIKTLLYNLLVGVKFIHSAGILHRDLKPANCLVNQDCSVKICDFGLARTIGVPDATHLESGEDDSISLVGVPHTMSLKRQLTGHVVTRWYRAPELILLQENYSEAIDVWSVGCIFAELLTMMKENVEQHADRGPLFPGSSCFPLSPDQKHGADYEFKSKYCRDQLSMIFNVLGVPSEEDIHTLEKEDAQRYIRIFDHVPGVDLQERFKASTKDAIDLLRRMLVFNPKRRVSVDECLAHPFFDEIRVPSIETVATEKVQLPFNDWANLDEPSLRAAFLREIQLHHKDLSIPKCFADLKMK